MEKGEESSNLLASFPIIRVSLLVKKVIADDKRFVSLVWDVQEDVYKRQRLLNEAMREMEADRVFYPDANSTMRLSFGMVGGYSCLLYTSEGLQVSFSFL